MNPPIFNLSKSIRELVARALDEDLGPGDVTTDSLVAEGESAAASLVARASCVVAGLELATHIFHAVDERLRVTARTTDGSTVEAGQALLDVNGPARGLLTAERVVLNFLQRLCGIATLTRRFVEQAEPYGVTILDTRKTTPTFRELEKYAVRCGGGQNHRMGLYDRVMIKDNHVALWSRQGGRGIADAVAVARERHPGLLVEVEVDDYSTLCKVWNARPDWILLDNMTPEELQTCVAERRGDCKLEASGGMTLEQVQAVAATGVDAISVGALTHSVPSIDLGLDIRLEGAGA